MQKTSLQPFRMEAYWSVDGVLTHGTITVNAKNASQAEKFARKNKVKPENPTDHDLACDNNLYKKDYYDVERLPI